MKQFISNLWLKLSDETREKIISAWHTFVSTFFTTILVTLSTGQIEWSWSFWGAILAVALRQAWKSTFNVFAPPSLGGRRGCKR